MGDIYEKFKSVYDETLPSMEKSLEERRKNNTRNGKINTVMKQHFVKEEIKIEMYRDVLKKVLTNTVCQICKSKSFRYPLGKHLEELGNSSLCGPQNPIAKCMKKK